MVYIEKVKTKISGSKFLRREKFTPCTESEVASLEEQLNLSLPLAYKEFLLWAGRKCGSLFRGSDYTFEYLLDLQDVEELLEENNCLEALPNDAFIFWMHQGYKFLFFRTSEGQNPPIYFWIESKDRKSFERIHSSFTEWIFYSIEYKEKIEKRLREG